MPKTKDKQMDFRKLEVVADEFTGKLTSAVVVAIPNLTNNSAGTANDIVEAMPAATAASTDTSAASLASVNTALTAIRNNIADLTVKLNALLTALK